MKKEQPLTAETFWNRAAARYASQPISDIPAYEATLDRVRSHLTPDDRMLEVGCGTGSTALILAPGVARMTATDISAEMIGIAAAKDNPHGVSFVRAGAEAAIPGAPFDVVCAFNLLHLLEDLDAGLAALAAQLRPGGLLIGKTPCIGERGPLIRLMILAMRAVGKAPYVHAFDKAALERAHRRAGFEIIDRADFGSGGMSRFLVARKT